MSMFFVEKPHRARREPRWLSSFAPQITQIFRVDRAPKKEDITPCNRAGLAATKQAAGTVLTGEGRSNLQVA